MAVKQEERLCHEVGVVREFTYQSDRMSAGGRCEAVVTAKTRCECLYVRKCDELLYGKRFPLKLKRAIYKSYVRPSNMHRSEARCLKENEMGIL